MFEWDVSEDDQLIAVTSPTASRVDILSMGSLHRWSFSDGRLICSNPMTSELSEQFELSPSGAWIDDDSLVSVGAL